MRIDEIIEFLSDGKEHKLSEILTKFKKLGIIKVNILLEFLEAYGMVAFKNKETFEASVELTRSVLTWLKKIQVVERAEVSEKWARRAARCSLLTDMF